MKSGCSNFAKKSFSFYKMKGKCLKLGMYDGHYCFYNLHLFYLAYILTRLFLLLQVRIAVRVGARAREQLAAPRVSPAPGTLSPRSRAWDRVVSAARVPLLCQYAIVMCVDGGGEGWGSSVVY